MMNVPLSIPMLLRRARTLFAHKEIVWRRADKRVDRYTYGLCLRRCGQLMRALRRLGVQPGDRIATLAWNHARHLEAYYGVPAMGAVLNTLNLRLHPSDLAYIINHAGDSVVFVDDVLLPLWEKVAPLVNVSHVIVWSDSGAVPEGMLDYERLLAAEGDDPSDFADVDENSAAIMCYTSGTTGKPKGVLYSHRSLVLHTLGAALADVLATTERDIVLPVVPMFHANAWGLPFTCAMLGANQVHPGPHLDPQSLLALLADERVTFTAGVPSIWLGILHALDAEPKKYDLSALRTLVCGGAAVPEAMIRGYQERHGLSVLQGWGMTEMSPIGSIGTLGSVLDSADADTRYAYRARQGLPAALVEIRARCESGLIPWDDATMGELEVRGPWVASGYYNPDDPVTSFTEDGWFRTGDIVTIDPHGYIMIQDRAKDLIKSGGEWISSVALESALMGHPDVSEAAVVAIAHEKWIERPLAVVSLKPGRSTTPAILKAFLETSVAKWWIPDDVVFVPAIPKTGAGKFLKSALREQFRDHYAVAPSCEPLAAG
jgi:fatty-acyl-CoA synthase